MAGRETGSKVVDGKVVAPDELPELGSPNHDVIVDSMTDGRLSIEPVHGGIRVRIESATVLREGLVPAAVVQGFNKQNQWKLLHEVSPIGGQFTISPPKKADPSQEFIAVRLLELTCQVQFGGNDEKESKDGR